MRFKPPHLASYLACLILLIGCGGDPAPFTDTVTLTKLNLQALKIEPEQAILNAHETLQLHALGIQAEGHHTNLDQAVNWHSSHPDIASVDANGLVSTHQDGATQVTAQIAHLTATLNLTVRTAELIALSVALPGTITSCQPHMPDLQGDYSDGSTRNVTNAVQWSVVSGNAFFDASGLLVARRAGAIEVQADTGRLRARAETTAVDSLESITLTSTDTRLAVGDTLSLTAMGTFSDGTVLEITQAAVWNSLTPNLASISAPGVVKGVSPGPVTIEASCGGQRGTLGLEVGIDDNPIALEINDGNGLTLNAGEQVDLTADAILANGERQDVTQDVFWSVAATDANLVIEVSNRSDSEGRVTASGVGTAFVKATYKSKEAFVEIDYR